LKEAQWSSWLLSAGFQKTKKNNAKKLERIKIGASVGLNWRQIKEPIPVLDFEMKRNQ
jgi:hypothetical protein